jgi:hypothetical protein
VKKIELRESKTLLQIRKIKEEMAHEAQRDSKYYQRLNGLGGKLLKRYRARQGASGKQSKS